MFSDMQFLFKKILSNADFQRISIFFMFVHNFQKYVYYRKSEYI